MEKRLSGFTLLELLLVISIITILSSLVLFVLRPAELLNNTNSAQRNIESKSVEDAIKSYIFDNNGSLPSEILNYSESFPANLCKYGEDCDGVNLDILVDGGYVSAIPDNNLEGTTNSELTGYKINYNPNDLSVSIIPYEEDETPNCWHLASGNYQEKVIVSATPGCNYTTISAALAAITDASVSKRYLISVMPGTYNASLTMKPYVDLVGAGIDETIIGNNIYAASQSTVKNFTMSMSGAQAWKAGYDAYSGAVANPTYIENVKMNFHTTTGPIYPLLTKTGSFMYATNVTINTSARASGDGFYAITHNAGGGVFRNLDVTMTMNAGGTGRDDMGIVNTFWASNSTIENSTFNLTNNVITNANEDHIFDKDLAAILVVRNSDATYTSATKTVRFLRTVSGGSYTLENVTGQVTSSASGVNVWGIDDVLGGTINNLNLTINKTGGGIVYGIKTTSTNTNINNSTLNVSNTVAGGTAYGFHVTSSSPTVVNSNFTASDDGASQSYGGYLMTTTCNPTLTSTTFTGGTSNLYIGPGCVPVIN